MERCYLLNSGLIQEREVYINTTFISSLIKLDFFFPPSNSRCSFSSQFSLFLQEKKWKLTGHLSICATQEQHIISRPAGQLVYALKCDIWLPFLTVLVCGANSLKIIEFLIRCSCRICLNDFQLQGIIRICILVCSKFALFCLSGTIHSSGL